MEDVPLLLGIGRHAPSRFSQDFGLNFAVRLLR
jgi:hypothetical protein